MKKHVDAIALAAIVVGFLAYTGVHNARVFPRIDRFGTHVNHVVERIEMHARQILERVRIAGRP